MASTGAAGETASAGSRKMDSSRHSRSSRECQSIGAPANLEQMDNRVLTIQNKNLTGRLAHYQSSIEELKTRNEQLQQRLSATDSEIFMINRHTKSLDENIRLLIQRFNVEELQSEADNPSSPLTSFVNQLATLDEEEMDKNLSGRAQEMLNTIGRLVQVYETVWNQSRNVIEKMKNNDNIDERLKNSTDAILKKNSHLEKQVIGLQEKYHNVALMKSKAEDQLTQLETERDEQKNRAVDLAWSLEKEQIRREKAETLVVDLREKVKSYEAQLGALQVGAKAKEGLAAVVAPASDLSISKMGDMVTEIEELKTKSDRRLEEIEQLHKVKVDLIGEVEAWRVKSMSPPDELIESSAKYKSLQTAYSVLCLEHEKVREYYKTAKDAVTTLRSSYLEQLKKAQLHEEDGSQTLQTFLSNLQAATNATRREYQLLRVEYEQKEASRETSGTNKDYDKLFKSVMQENNAMRSEIARLRKKAGYLQNELNRCIPKDHPRSVLKTTSSITPEKPRPISESEQPPQKRDSDGSSVARARLDSQGQASSERNDSPDGRGDSATIKELRRQLKEKTQEYDAVMVLYEITKQNPKFNRELVDVMASEKKLRDENVDLKRSLVATEQKLKDLEAAHSTSSKELEAARAAVKNLEEKLAEIEKEREKEKQDRQRGGPDEEMLKKMKFLEESLMTAKKALQANKVDEEALMNEMDITGQALEDLQNQNKQLIDQLKEKDNTNLKFMTDSIRMNQSVKVLREEKQAQEVRFRTAQDIIRKVEETVRLAEERIKSVEDTNNILEEDRKNADYLVDSWKRKAFEQTKERNDLRLKLEQLEKELKFIKTVHADKLKNVEGDIFKGRRLIEENAELKRKLDRAKMLEVTGSGSEDILNFELNEFRALITCTSCRTNRKDTVLTKCYHVFCYSCISKRYETRQRRCPQCTTTFGANDYHRLYLT